MRAAILFAAKIAPIAALVIAAVLGVRWWVIALFVGVGLLVGAIVWLLSALSQSTNIWR